MSGRPRCVFDTSVIVSAFLFDQAKPGQALQTALEQGKVLLSTDVVQELRDVLRRAKFDRYIRLERREALLKGLVREATLVDIAERIRACRDPEDDKFLELAVSGKADCLVSGDQDLLTLHPFRDIPILTASAFLDWVQA